MEVTLRDAVTIVHGTFFGALLLLAFTDAVMGMYAISTPEGRWNITPAQQRWLSLYIALLALLALLAWLTVLLGAYAVYPWHRAHSHGD